MSDRRYAVLPLALIMTFLFVLISGTVSYGRTLKQIETNRRLLRQTVRTMDSLRSVADSLQMFHMLIQDTPS